jgi:hypothetical protein
MAPDRATGRQVLGGPNDQRRGVGTGCRAGSITRLMAFRSTVARKGADDAHQGADARRRLDGCGVDWASVPPQPIRTTRVSLPRTRKGLVTASTGMGQGRSWQRRQLSSGCGLIRAPSPPGHWGACLRSLWTIDMHRAEPVALTHCHGGRLQARTAPIGSRATPGLTKSRSL